MAEDFTVEDVVKAARAVGLPEFTRADIAKQLGVRRQDIKESFKAARKTGQVRKTRRDDEGRNYFALTDESPVGESPAGESSAGESGSRLPWRR